MDQIGLQSREQMPRCLQNSRRHDFNNEDVTIIIFHILFELIFRDFNGKEAVAIFEDFEDGEIIRYSVL